MTSAPDITWLDTPDGTRLALREWAPAGGARATVQLVHGLSEHAGRYGRVADALVADGYAVSAMDHRGHGRTAESTGPGRFGEGADAGRVLDDVRLVTARLAEAHPGVPHVLVGHSLGSVIALASAQRDGAELAGLVLSGPLGVNQQLAGMLPQLRAAVDAGMGGEPFSLLGDFNAPFEPARTSYDWLSRDESEVDAYLADPLCGDDVPPTYGYAAAMFGLAVQVATPEAVAALPAKLPVLLLSGQRDPVGGVDAEQVTALADLLRQRDLPVEQHVYPDARHEVLNETNRDEVTADLRAWLDQLIDE